MRRRARTHALPHPAKAEAIGLCLRKTVTVVRHFDFDLAGAIVGCANVRCDHLGAGMPVRIGQPFCTMR